MSAGKHTPVRRHVERVKIGSNTYAVVFCADGSVSRVTYTNAVLGRKPLRQDLPLAQQAIALARAAIAKATGSAT